MSPSTYVFTISHQITSSDTWEEIVVDRILGIESQEPQEEDELKYIIEIELLRANDTYNINKETNNTKNDTYNVVADAIDGNDVYHETYNINKETNNTKKPIMQIMKPTKPRTLRIIW